MYDVFIVGGGVAGLSCALTLIASTKRLPFAQELQICVADTNESDLLKAELNYCAGVAYGTSGKDELSNMKKLIKRFDSDFEIQNKKVVSIIKDNVYTITLEDNTTTKAKAVVLASGFHTFDIQGLDIQIVPHKKSPREGKIMVANIEELASNDLYVAGLLAGVPTMYSCASGSGVEVACDILSKLAGKIVVVHDVVK